MKKYIVLFAFLFTTLFMSGITASAQSAQATPIPQDVLTAYQKGHVVKPNPKVVAWFNENGLSTVLPRVIWYKYKGLLYSFVSDPNSLIPIIWIFKPNGDVVDIITLLEL